jgi:hypothetical protein
LFLNLYVLEPDFGDHNFADFGRVEQVEASYIRGHLKQSYEEGCEPIEPYFFAMMRCTLSVGAARAYIHATPKSKRIEYARRIAGIKRSRNIEVPF